MPSPSPSPSPSGFGVQSAVVCPSFWAARAAAWAARVATGTKTAFLIRLSNAAPGVKTRLTPVMFSAVNSLAVTAPLLVSEIPKSPSLPSFTFLPSSRFSTRQLVMRMATAVMSASSYFEPWELMCSANFSSGSTSTTWFVAYAFLGSSSCCGLPRMTME